MKPSFIIAISLFAVSLSGQAATPSVKSCAAIKDPVERLACYDKLAGRSPADSANASGTTSSAVNPVAPKTDVVAPAAPAVTPSAPPVEPTPDAVAVFGLEYKQKQKEEQPDKLQLKWTEKKKDPYGNWIITLENGQVWHQIDSRHFYFVNPDHWVVISRGVLHSFFLGEPGRNGGIRVKRIK
jgi:hypothetical protein